MLFNSAFAILYVIGYTVTLSIFTAVMLNKNHFGCATNKRVYASQMLMEIVLLSENGYDGFRTSAGAAALAL